MAERKRNKEIHFYVTEEEHKLIRRKMIESKTKNMGAYLRKMAIDGYIVNTDTTPLKKQYEEMHKIGVNINQIAKKVKDVYKRQPYTALCAKALCTTPSKYHCHESPYK